MRLNDWNTNPILRLRMSAWRFSSSRRMSTPSSRYRPRLGRSRQPMMFISVDLPDPDAPITAT